MAPEIKITLLLAVMLFYLFAIFSSKTGIFGEYIRSITLGAFGSSGYAVPFVLFFTLALASSKRMEKNRARFSAGIITFFIASFFFEGYRNLPQILKIFSENQSTLKLSYQSGITGESGGVIGNLVTVLAYKAAGSLGILILMILLALLSIYFFTRYSVVSFQKDLSKAKEEFQRRKDERAQRVEEFHPSEEIPEPKGSYLFSSERNQGRPVVDPPQSPQPSREMPQFNLSEDFLRLDPRQEEPEIHLPEEEKILPTDSPISESRRERENERVEAPTADETAAFTQEVEKQIQRKQKTYRKPPFSLLQSASSTGGNTKAQRQQMIEQARKLEQILETFGVKGQVLEVTKGPIVNRFEIQLEPGIKISKITGLSEDIALNLAVPQVRVAPVPGKSTVGIEVPNKEKDSVTLLEILRSKEYKNSTSELSIALGKDISGNAVVGDLAKMPHLLIAGSTGSGKSVCINTIITSLLYNASPEDVKLLMVDPKVVELSNYNGIPHLILPVVTDPKKAAIALGWAVNEMTRRYEVIAQAKVRDIYSYNKKFPEEKLPRIVVIIDELADLMMVAPTQVEDSIARLTQMARAAGIHLIVATQRPSTDVITGQIKTNIPSRISFAVSSAIDSRIILDSSGAEKLLGKGDMLYQPMGSNRAKRVQGCFISDEEIASIVEYIKGQEIQTVYQEEILEKTTQASETDYDDEHLEDAIRLVIEMKSASASMLQRRFRIGYNRAGRLIDMMEELGIVGPPQSSKPRDVLVSSFEEVEPWN